MHDFYAASAPAPLDQADGLRRLFGGSRRALLPVVANPHPPSGAIVLERITSALTAAGRRTLLVDAAGCAPPPRELALVDLGGGIERLSAEVWYLAARGLPRLYVDTRGSAARLLDALADAAPQADVLLVHAEMSDLARMLMRRAVRPLLLAADAPESVKHAYAAAKLLAQRCELRTFDLLLAAPPSSPRLASIAASVAATADRFIGALLNGWAVIDPASDLHDPPDAALERLLAEQLDLDDEGLAPLARAATPT